MPNRNKFSKQQKIDILQHYLLNSMSPVNTLRSLRRLWNDRFLNIKGTTFRHLLDIFRRHGAVEYQRKREHTARTPQNIERVKEIVGEASEEQRPSSSYRIAAQIGVSQSTVWRILRKDLKLKPYHIKLVHKLNEDDFDRRVEFSEILLDRHSSDDSILDRIIWTDEAIFSLSNTVNRHNCVYWDKENPNISLTIDGIGSEKIMVWCGISTQHKLGPFFFQGSLNGPGYARFLEETVFPSLQEIRQDFGEHFIFQQDGAPPHYHTRVRELLSDTFTEWIGRRGILEWSPRSPDLSPPDFFLWGYLKDKVFAHAPSSLDELKQLITDEFNRIPQEMVARACRSVKERCQLCCFLEGKQLKLHKERS